MYVVWYSVFYCSWKFPSCQCPADTRQDISPKTNSASPLPLRRSTPYLIPNSWKRRPGLGTVLQSSQEVLHSLVPETYPCTFLPGQTCSPWAKHIALSPLSSLPGHCHHGVTLRLCKMQPKQRGHLLSEIKGQRYLQRFLVPKPTFPS